MADDSSPTPALDIEAIERLRVAAEDEQREDESHPGAACWDTVARNAYDEALETAFPALAAEIRSLRRKAQENAVAHDAIDIVARTWLAEPHCFCPPHNDGRPCLSCRFTALRAMLADVATGFGNEGDSPAERVRCMRSYVEAALKERDDARQDRYANGSAAVKKARDERSTALAQLAEVTREFERHKRFCTNVTFHQVEAQRDAALAAQRDEEERSCRLRATLANIAAFNKCRDKTDVGTLTTLAVRALTTDGAGKEGG